MSFFLDQEAAEIINKMTDNPFAINGDLWLYWLFKLQLIPGSWSAIFYLEDDHGTLNPRRSYSGLGSPSEAVKNAYNSIDEEWLEKGFSEGKKLKTKMEGTCLK